MNYINHFRPIYEFRPLFVWPVAIVGILVSGMPYGWVFALVCLALLVVRGFQVWRALSFRMAISTKWLSKIHIGKLLATGFQPSGSLKEGLAAMVAHASHHVARMSSASGGGSRHMLSILS